MVKRGFMALVMAFALAFFALCACGCSDDSSNGSSNSGLATIVVGSDTYPPYVSNDENGNPVGIDVEILTEAFHRIGYEPEFKYIDWEKKTELLESGEIDCIASCFSMTGRESQYQWAGPYMKSRQVVAVDPASSIYSLSDLEGKVVAVQSTTKPESIILEQQNSKVPKVKNVFSFADRDYIKPALAKGYVDAIAAHETSILSYEKDYGVSYRILDESLQDVGLGVAFSNSDSGGVAQKLDAVFNEMLADGTIRNILSGYFDDPSSFVDMEGLDE